MVDVSNPWSIAGNILNRSLLRPGSTIYLGAVLMLFGSVAFGFWPYGGDWIPELMPIWLLVGYTIVVHAFIVAQFRFLVPLVPSLLCPGAYIAMRALADLRRHVR